MNGRRIPLELGLAGLERAGDYLGPTPVGWAGYAEARVFFLLPNRDELDEAGARSVYAVASPPHVFRECLDGSLEIRESIAAYGNNAEPVWHGYLDEGHVWRRV